MDGASLRARLRRAPILDAREPAEFARAHLRNAVNIPARELRSRSGELPPAKDASGLCLCVNAADEAEAREWLISWTLVDVIDTADEQLWRVARDADLVECGEAHGRFLWRPSPHLAPVCESIEEWMLPTVRRALDLGCGRGRDAVWLASRGWSVVGVDNQPVFLAHLRDFASRQQLGAHVLGVCLDLTHGGPEAWEALRPLLRPPLALINLARFLHRGLLDFVVGAMPAGCVLAVHHFVEGAVSLKSGRSIKPHDADMCSLRPCELRRRYDAALPLVLLDDEAHASCDGARPMASYAARKPPLVRVEWEGERVRLRVCCAR